MKTHESKENTFYNKPKNTVRLPETHYNASWQNVKKQNDLELASTLKVSVNKWTE